MKKGISGKAVWISMMVLLLSECKAPICLNKNLNGYGGLAEEVCAKIILPPSQIISHSKNLRESNFSKFDQIYMIK